MRQPLPYDSLLARIGERLGSLGTGTDHRLLTRWRVLRICHYLLASPDAGAERLSIEALNSFAQLGVGKSTDAALSRALSAIAQDRPEGDRSVLPSLAPSKRKEVLVELERLEQLREDAIRLAVDRLPLLRDRLRRAPVGPLLAGIRHRLELVAAVATDESVGDDQRAKAAASILYLDELHDAIPDALGDIGMLDDDFALRIVLDQLGRFTEDEVVHWSERISALWDDLPFLQGVQLDGEGGPVTITWLDRLNSYISYLHTLDRDAKLLVLIQPSVACSPLHPIVSLVGLLVLEALTSAGDQSRSLQEGEVYEIDGAYYCRYGGISQDSLLSGRLILEFKDGLVYRKAAIARRMVSVRDHPLSTAKSFAAAVHWNDAEPIQRFFNWDEAIGAASIQARIVLVTTRNRALKMFQGIGSNSISLLSGGLVRFAGLNPTTEDLRGGLVLVVPDLSVARQLLDEGLDVCSIVIDGYRRLHCGRHELPFIMSRASAPAVVVWSSCGYCPTDLPEWLPEHRRLEVSRGDMERILELEDAPEETMTSGRASLWQAATAAPVRRVLVEPTAEEHELLGAVAAFFDAVRQCPELPDFWRYHMYSTASLLQALIAATPAYWSDIREAAASWTAAFEEKWATIRSHKLEGLSSVANSHQTILRALASVSQEKNSKAEALLSLGDKGEKSWQLVCDRPEQIKLVGRLIRKSGVTSIEPVRLRDLEVCCACIVIGWQDASFGRKLWAHTPSYLIEVVSQEEARRWNLAASQARRTSGGSILEAVGYRQYSREESSGTEVTETTNPEPIPNLEPVRNPEPNREKVSAPIQDESSLRPCVFLWLADEPQGKILAPDARVLMEVGDQAKERHAARIKPEDRIILGPGSDRWSPADEFTNAVVRGVEDAFPGLAGKVKEWRLALDRLMRDKGWPLELLRSKLEEVGVTREQQTLEGWLRLDQSAPIGPQHIHRELLAIWKLVGGTYTQAAAPEIADACSRLRALRSASGRTLLKHWKKKAVDSGSDKEWLDELVERLQEEVEVHEVDAISFGRVPEAMIGWRISPELAARYERLHSEPINCNPGEIVSEDD